MCGCLHTCVYSSGIAGHYPTAWPQKQVIQQIRNSKRIVSEMKRLVLWIMLLLALAVAIAGGNALINTYREAASVEAIQRQLAAQASEAEARAAKTWVDTQTEQQAANSVLVDKELSHLSV